MKIRATLGATVVALSVGAALAAPSNDRADLQARASDLYQAAAAASWTAAYAMFVPELRGDTAIEQFKVLFTNNRPFRCLEARVKKVTEDDDPFAASDPKSWERQVEVTMLLKVEYPDGRRATIRDYSDMWILSNGTWYFAANLRGPYEW